MMVGPIDCHFVKFALRGQALNRIVAETALESPTDITTGPHRQRRESLKGSLTGGCAMPIRGPITAFAFLNTLQALEELPFDEGCGGGLDCTGPAVVCPKSATRQPGASRIRRKMCSRYFGRPGRRADS